MSNESSNAKDLAVQFLVMFQAFKDYRAHEEELLTWKYGVLHSEFVA